MNDPGGNDLDAAEHYHRQRVSDTPTDRPDAAELHHMAEEMRRNRWRRYLWAKETGRDEMPPAGWRRNAEPPY